MPLVEIRRVSTIPDVSRIDEYEAALTDELAERQRILAYVRRYLKEEQMPSRSTSRRSRRNRT